jgi:four helix bundle protein
MKPKDLADRTHKFSISVIKFSGELPDTEPIRIIVRQLLRSATSVGANYRAARRSKSTRDFINKLKIVEEECDESLYWLEVLHQTMPQESENISSLIKEANELVSIFVTAINTAKSNFLAAEKQKSTSHL